MSGATARFCTRTVSQLQLHARAATLPRRGSRIKDERLAKVGNETRNGRSYGEAAATARVPSRETLCLLTFGEGRGTDVALDASMPRPMREKERNLGAPYENLRAVREKDSVTFSTAARLALLDYDRSRRITNIVYVKKWKVLLQDRGNVISAAGRCFLSRFKNAESGNIGRNLILQLSDYHSIFLFYLTIFNYLFNIKKHYRNQSFAADFLISHVRVSELRKAAFYRIDVINLTADKTLQKEEHSRRFDKKNAL